SRCRGPVVGAKERGIFRFESYRETAVVGENFTCARRKFGMPRTGSMTHGYLF
ncbi:unnamed protein product, partial [Larinioides sclopetarius]